jgi:hypothetical protein
MKSFLVYDVNTAIVPKLDPLHLDPKPLTQEVTLSQPIGGDVKQVWEMNQWKPRVAFGVSIASSQTPIFTSNRWSPGTERIINEEAVTFASKCVYDKGGSVSPEEWFPLKKGGGLYALPTGDAIGSVFAPEKWESIRQEGRVLLPVKSKASWQYWSSCLLLGSGICQRTRKEPVWFETPIIQSPTVLMNVEDTCPKFGSGPGPFVDKAACSSFPEAFTTCAYPVESHLVGKCSTKQCVLDGIDMFARTYDTLGTKSGDTNPSNTTTDPTTMLGLGAKLRRDAALARLWEGSTAPGQCATADPTLSCLSLLDTDCSKIFQFATRVQPHSQQLYDAVVKAGQVCARKQ